MFLELLHHLYLFIAEKYWLYAFSVIVNIKVALIQQ